MDFCQQLGTPALCSPVLYNKTVYSSVPNKRVTALIFWRKNSANMHLKETTKLIYLLKKMCKVCLNHRKFVHNYVMILLNMQKKYRLFGAPRLLIFPQNPTNKFGLITMFIRNTRLPN